QRKSARSKTSSPQPDVRKPWRLKDDELVERLKAKGQEIEWQDYSNDILTNIDPATIAGLRSEGIALQWCTTSVLGQEFPQRMSEFERNGWVPLEPGQLGIDVVRLPGLVLCARSLTLDNKARAYQHAQAEAPLGKIRTMMGEGIPVREGNHPSATRNYNKIRKTMERLEIPTDD